MAEKFSCCSHYKECSNAGACLFPTDDDYKGCSYNQHLLAGRNFYSEKPKSTKIFIDCYERNFKIGRRSRTGLTYSLTKEQLEILEKAFTENMVPYTKIASTEKSIIEGNPEEPANSLIFLKLENEEFNIGNFNQALILNKYAEGIAKSLNNKGFKATVELNSTYANNTRTINQKKFDAEAQQVFEKPVQKVIPKKTINKVNYTQVSIFDLVG